MKSKNRKSLICLFLLLEVSLIAPPALYARTDKLITVIARTHKHRYRQGDKIKLDVLIRNDAERPVYFYSYLTWGLSASLSLRVFDQGGKEVRAMFLDDALTPLPPAGDMQFYTNLYPAHFFGTTRESTLRELGIRETGGYAIVVEYHSPIPKKYGQGFKLFSREEGVFKSKPLRIEVVAYNK